MIALLPGISAFGQCTPAPTEKTRWGGNTNVVIQESRPTRSIHGIVKDRADEPLADVLVEVYDQPEIVLQNPRPDRDGQRRIAGCITAVAG